MTRCDRCGYEIRMDREFGRTKQGQVVHYPATRCVELLKLAIETRDAEIAKLREDLKITVRKSSRKSAVVW